MMFLARYSGRTLDSYRVNLRQFFDPASRSSFGSSDRRPPCATRPGIFPTSSRSPAPPPWVRDHPRSFRAVGQQAGLERIIWLRVGNASTDDIEELLTAAADDVTVFAPDDQDAVLVLRRTATNRRRPKNHAQSRGQRRSSAHAA